MYVDCIYCIVLCRTLKHQSTFRSNPPEQVTFVSTTLECKARIAIVEHKDKHFVDDFLYIKLNTKVDPYISSKKALCRPFSKQKSPIYPLCKDKILKFSCQ